MKSRSKTAPTLPRSTSEHTSTVHTAPTSRRPIRAGDGAHPLGTKFNPSTCHRCHAITLAGYAAEGVLIHLDPTPLNITTEIDVLRAGRRSWHMTRNLEVIWRSGTRITYQPAGNHRDYAAFAEHGCGHRTPVTISAWSWAQHAPSLSHSKEPGF